MTSPARAWTVAYVVELPHWSGRSGFERRQSNHYLKERLCWKRFEQQPLYSVRSRKPSLYTCCSTVTNRKDFMCDTPYPNKPMKEHQTVTSRITGRKVEIAMTPGHAVPKNPFLSLQQSKLMHARPELIGGKKKLKEWERSTDYAHLPKKVKK